MLIEDIILTLCMSLSKVSFANTFAFILWLINVTPIQKSFS